MTDARPSLRKLSLWDSWADNTVSIIPNSGIQIIDLGFNINVNIAFSAHFHEEKTQEGRHSLNEVDDTSDEYEALSDKNEILYTVLGQNSAAEKNVDASRFWVIFENSQKM